MSPEWGDGKSACGNDDVVGVSATVTSSDRKQPWSSLKAGRTGEVRQEPNVAFFRKEKRQFRVIVDDRGPMFLLHTCDLNLKTDCGITCRLLQRLPKESRAEMDLAEERCLHETWT